MADRMPWDITAAGADGEKADGETAAPAARPRPGRHLIAVILIGAAVLDLTRCGLVLAAARHPAPTAGLAAAGLAAAVLSMRTARGYQAGRRWAGSAALLIGATSAPQAAMSGFHGLYTIPDTATAALGVLLAVAVLATAGAAGQPGQYTENPCTHRQGSHLVPRNAPRPAAARRAQAGTARGRTVVVKTNGHGLGQLDEPAGRTLMSEPVNATAPLDGLTVLEVSSFVAAPLGGLTLAQLGADVIRIDPVGGGADLSRWPLAPSGTSLYWTSLNKGKRSVTLNFRDADGRRLLGELLAASGPGGGIVLTNAAGQEWLAHPALARVRPDLIHLQIQGYRDGRAAVDYTVNAETGFPLITGPEDLAGPVNHVLPAWDVTCGLYAAVGLLAAERRRQRTGEGSAITLALADVALAVAGHLGFLAEAQVTRTDRPRIGNHLYGGLARDFRTADGERVMVVALTRRHFADLAAATGLSGTFTELERLLGADFGQDGDRYRHREVITALLEPWFAGRTVAEVERDLAGTSVLWSRYRRFTDLDLTGNPLLAQITQPGVGPLLAPGSPLAMDGTRGPSPAPLLGADTAAVLTGLLGLSAVDIRALSERGIIG
jgi:2-methylfumaryl-CoA isomerase